MQTETIAIADVDSNPQLQVRAAINLAVVEEYAELMRNGVAFPPIRVMYDGLLTYFIVDGWHRFSACAKNGDATLDVEIVGEGSARDALLAAVGANKSHGLRRTNADKRRAVEVLLRDPEWAAWSDRRIADECGVSNELVRAVRQDHAPPDQVSDSDTCGKTANQSNAEPAKRIGKDGKSYKVPEPREERKKKAEPAPKEPPKKKNGAEAIDPQKVAACKRSWGEFVRLLDTLGWMSKVDGASKEIARTLAPLWKDA